MLLSERNETKQKKLTHQISPSSEDKMESKKNHVLKVLLRYIWHFMTVSIKQSLNNPVIKSYSVPAFFFGQKIRANANKHVTYEQQVWLVFNFEEDWYSPAYSAKLCKEKIFILLRIFTENVQFYKLRQKGKKKSLSNH